MSSKQGEKAYKPGDQEKAVKTGSLLAIPGRFDRSGNVHAQKIQIQKLVLGKSIGFDTGS